MRRNGFGTHARPFEVNLGVPKFDSSFLYKHDFIGIKSNLLLLGDEPLENLDTWIEVFFV
jgi:hypothetical protein